MNGQIPKYLVDLIKSIQTNIDKKRTTMITENQNKPIAGSKLILALPLFTIISVILCSSKPDLIYDTPEISRFLNETIIVEPIFMFKLTSLQDTVYSRVEESPQFIGGVNGYVSFVSKNLKYPDKCKEDGIEGVVLIMIIIEKDGTVSKPEVLKSINPLLDNEALRIAKILPKFKPGKHNGIPVRVSIVMPVNFKL